MFPTLLFDDSIIDAAAVADQALRAAAGFSTLGVLEGDVVAVMLRNEPAALIAALGTRHLGAYWCGMNWHLQAAEVQWILHDSGAKVLVLHADLAERTLPAVPPGVTVLVVREQELTRRMHGLNPPRDIARGTHDWDDWLARQVPSTAAPKPSRGFLPYTSGTTGRPKGVRRKPVPMQFAQTQRQAQARVAAVVYGIEAAARCILPAPLYHSAAAAYALFCAQVGAQLRIEPRFDAKRLLEVVEHDAATHLYLVPTMYNRLLSLSGAERGRRDLRSIRFVSSTGSPCPPQMKQAMIDWWGPVITEAYGSSETGFISFIDSGEWRARPGSVGRPLGDAQVRILDDAGHACPTGQAGTIYVHQPAYADFDYINNSEARRGIEKDGFVTLGDVGFVDDESYLYISDRKADMIISGGVNIYPAEIESALASMPGVADCAVFGIPDDEWGEAVAAAIEPQPQAQAQLDADAVRAFLRARVAGYKLPRLVEFHSRLPREDSGKIFKRRLRAPHWERAGRNI